MEDLEVVAVVDVSLDAGETGILPDHRRAVAFHAYAPPDVATFAVRPCEARLCVGPPRLLGRARLLGRVDTSAIVASATLRPNREVLIVSIDPSDFLRESAVYEFVRSAEFTRAPN